MLAECLGRGQGLGVALQLLHLADLEGDARLLLQLAGLARVVAVHAQAQPHQQAQAQGEKEQLAPQPGLGGDQQCRHGRGQGLFAHGS